MAFILDRMGYASKVCQQIVKNRFIPTNVRDGITKVRRGRTIAAIGRDIVAADIIAITPGNAVTHRDIILNIGSQMPPQKAGTG